MQSGGQYGVPSEVPQYGVVNTRGPSTTPHGNMFTLSHEVAGGLGLSNTTPSVSHGGHHGHGGHTHGHGQSPHPQYQQGQSHHHHQQHQQQQAAATQPYLHFQDQQSQHHQQHQSLQSAQHQAASTLQQEQAQTHHQQQTQKQAMAPSVVVQHHSQEQLQQASILQQQYQNKQQHLGLSLESPKVLSPMANRQQPPPPSAAAVTPGNTAAAAATAVTGVGSQYSKSLAMADQSALDDTDGLGDDGERGSGGNRWPRQETLALLKIRSEMDASFRDSSLKRPLWEEASRKLAELGYQRSAKKCKEKFENVHKYYKRTKEGKAGRQDGKNYRFFSELEALYGNAGHTIANTSLSTSMFSVNTRSINVNDVMGSITGNPQAREMSISPANFLLGSSIGGPSRTADLTRPINPGYRPGVEDNSGLNFSSETSSSDDGNDDEYGNPSESKKRKRKSAGRMMAFFENLLKKVMEKQEQMQQRFLEALERREQDRMIREEAWKRQEMARMNREHDLRAQERSLAATRDAAIVAFLQKVTGQTVQLPPSTAIAVAAQPAQSHAPVARANPTLDPAFTHPSDDQDPFDPSSKRWPKPEVLALIKLRTSLHSRFIEPGPKGPLWEDISNGMSRLGYNRNAKRCKEKWENINKYFKKAKESNKNRPENAKTCPYYHQLDALYKQGVLGGGTAANIKQLPYKPSTDHLDGTEHPMQVQQPSASNRDGGLIAHGSTADQVLAIMPPASQLSTASDATASTSNVNVTAHVPAIHLFSITNPDSGGLSKETNLKPIGEPPPMRALDGGDVDRLVTENPSRQDFSEEITNRTSLQLQRQVASMDDQHHNDMNEGYDQKVDLEQEARLVNEEESHPQHVIHQQQIAHKQLMTHQQQVQYAQERPAGLPPPQSSSFIANMLQKFSNDPAESNTSTTSANKE